MKLNLGCGKKKIDGFINVDIRELSTADVVDDISKLTSFEENSIELIYASHVLEHFDRNNYKKVLQRWYELLKVGGILKISVPNFEEIVEQYNKNKNLLELIGLLYGGQTYKENYHHYCWDFKTLRQDLIDIGFKDVQLYDWRQSEHAHIDDFSQAYLPHMDKINGRLMSLNIEAIK